MQRAGTSSWRFAESEPQMLHVALFVRDSVGLRVPDAPDVSPRLDGDVPDFRAVLTEADRAAAGAHWLNWLRQLTAHEVEAQLPPSEGLDERSRLRRRVEQMQTITDPPGFTTFTDRPALRTAVAATFDEACLWANDIERSAESVPQPRFEWSLVKQAAEDVAFDRGVDIGDVNGTVLLLAVAGRWAHLLGPGVVLFSTESPPTRRRLTRCCARCSSHG